jgi:hypothetical protein
VAADLHEVEALLAKFAPQLDAGEAAALQETIAGLRRKLNDDAVPVDAFTAEANALLQKCVQALKQSATRARTRA